MLNSDCLQAFFWGKTALVAFFSAHLINSVVSGRQMGFSLVRGATVG